MLAAETNCPALTATPDRVRLPAAGRVVIFTLSRVLAPPAAITSFGSVRPKSALLKV
jgi:hypothetical protein